MKGGFTLAEVVVALVVLEVAVIGVLGTLVLSSRTLRQAERLRRATVNAESVLDSITRWATPGTDSIRIEDGWLGWIVDDFGAAEVVATSDEGRVLLRLESRVPVS